MRIERELFGRELDGEIARWVYVGDSTNDVLMFEHFPHSVGVANIRRFEAELTHPPRYITPSERGAPFWQTDFSLLKRFYVGQRQLHLRADVINLFNQDRYDNPVNLMNSPSFGQNTNDFGRRSVLLSAKVVF